MKRMSILGGVFLGALFSCISNNIFAEDYSLLLNQGIAGYNKAVEARKIRDSFLQLSYKGSLDEIKEYLQQNDGCINSNYNGNALHRVLKYRKEKVSEFVDFLISQGIDVNARDENGNTPLMILMESKKIEEEDGIAIIEKLLNAGANIDAQSNHKNTALHFAAFAGKCKCCVFLIKKGANIGITNSHNALPFDLVYSRELKEFMVKLYENQINWPKRWWQSFWRQFN